MARYYKLENGAWMKGVDGDIYPVTNIEELRKLRGEDGTIAGALGSFYHGAMKNIDEYGASATKLVGANDLQKHFNKKKKEHESKITNKYAGIWGNFVFDPINALPGGVFTKGSKVARIAKSTVGGAGVGYATMKTKNYGDDSLTKEQKRKEEALGAGLGAGVNALIAGVTRGKVRDLGFRKEPTDDVIVSKIKVDDFRLGNISKQFEKAQEVKRPDNIVSGNTVSTPTVKREKTVIDPNIHRKYTPNWIPRPANLPIVPPVQKSFVNVYFDNLLNSDEAKEALRLGENRSYKENRSPNIRVANRKIVNENSGKGWESSVIKELDVKNPEYDFMLTKSDVRKINNGKVDEKILDKLYNDIVVLKQQREADNLDEIERYFYKQRYPDIDFDKKPKNMDYDTWVDANRVFANAGSNLAIGAGAGTVNAVDTAMDGGSSEDIQSSFLKGLLLGAGGSSALSHLSPQYRKLITSKIDGNTAGMFVGAKPADTGAFSDIATRKAMKEIDDSGARLKRIPTISEILKKSKEYNSLLLKANELYSAGKTDEAMQLYKKAENYKNGRVTLDDVLEHPKLFEKYPEIKDIPIKIVDDFSINGAVDKNGNILINPNRSDEEIKQTLLHELQHAIQQKESWARGGSPEEFKNIKSNILREIKSLEQYLEDYIYTNPEYKKLDAEVQKAYDGGNIELGEKLEDELQKLFNELNGDNIVKRISQLSEELTNASPLESYKRLWGEQQARATAYRANMTPQERLKEGWTKTLEREEGKYNKPLIKYGDGVAQSIGKNKESPKAENPDNKIISQLPIKKNFHTSYLPIKESLDFLDKAGSKAISSLQHLTDKATEHRLSETIKKIKDSAIWNDWVKTTKLESRKNYMEDRDVLFKSIQKQNSDYEILHKQLTNISEDSRKALYDYLGGDDEVAKKLTSGLKKFGDDFRELINLKSKQLVELGVLDENTAKIWENRYLKRSYTKHLRAGIGELFSGGSKTISPIFNRGQELKVGKKKYEQMLVNGEVGSFFDGKAELVRRDGNTYYLRKDWSKEQRRKWGEIEDAAYALPNTLAKMDSMILHAEFLKKVADRSGAMMTKEKLQELYRAKFKDSDEVPDSLTKLESMLEDDLKELGFVKLSGKKFGTLRNRWVAKDVANDLKNLTVELHGFDSKYMEAYKKIVSYWKATHTIYNPTAHLNNLLSNVTMQFMNGERVSDAITNAVTATRMAFKHKRYLELRVKELTGFDSKDLAELKRIESDRDFKLFLEAKENGLFGRSSLNDILKDYALKGVELKSSLSSKVASKFERLYSAEDDIMRYSLYKSLRDRGKSVKEAVKIVNSVIPDYTKPMTAGGELARKYGFVPFYSWIYYSTPIILRQLKEHPVRFLALYGGIYAMYARMGVNPLNEKETPETFAWDRVPLVKSSDKIAWLKVDKWIPHWQLVSLPNDLVSAVLTSPVVGSLNTLKNVNPYFGNKVTWAKKGSGKYYADLIESSVKNWTPDILDNIYDVTKSKVVSKKIRRRTKYIEPRSDLQEFAKLLGVNVLTSNQKELREFVRRNELK